MQSIFGCLLGSSTFFGACVCRYRFLLCVLISLNSKPPLPKFAAISSKAAWKRILTRLVEGRSVCLLVEEHHEFPNTLDGNLLQLDALQNSYAEVMGLSQFPLFWLAANVPWLQRSTTFRPTRQVESGTAQHWQSGSQISDTLIICGWKTRHTMEIWSFTRCETRTSVPWAWRVQRPRCDVWDWLTCFCTT